jgi:hypothetical protein
MSVASIVATAMMAVFSVIFARVLVALLESDRGNCHHEAVRRRSESEIQYGRKGRLSASLAPIQSQMLEYGLLSDASVTKKGRRERERVAWNRKE